jgi:hypothetical protein
MPLGDACYLGRTPDGTIELVYVDISDRPRAGTIVDRTFLKMKRRSDGTLEDTGTYQARHLLVYRLKGREERDVVSLLIAAEKISDRFKDILISLMTRIVDGTHKELRVFDGLKDCARLLGFAEKLDRLKACCAKVRIKKIPPPRPKEK